MGYAEWLWDVINGLEIKKASIAGISQGGWTALRFATCYPAFVDKLILLTPAGIAPTNLSFLLKALLNAIAHKDYSGGVPIQISVYRDKIIFWNEGQLPENWTIKNLLVKHASRPYNPDIAIALFRSG